MPSLTRRHTTLAASVAAVAASALLAGPGAAAQEYTVNACSFVSPSPWRVESVGDRYYVANDCGPGTGNTGLHIRGADQGPNPVGSWTSLVLDAPPGTRIVRAQGMRMFMTRIDDMQIVGLADANGNWLESCQTSLYVNDCALGGQQLGHGSWADGSFFDVTDTTQLRLTARCNPSGITPTCAGTSAFAAMRVPSIAVVLRDTGRPVVTGASATGVPAGWVRAATITVNQTASDGGGGVRRQGVALVARNGVATTVASEDVACDFNRMVPCPATRAASATFTLNGIPDGTYTVHPTVDDATLGNQAQGGPLGTVLIDRTPPTAITGQSVNVTGTAPVVTWPTQPQGDASPIERVIWQYTPTGEAPIQGQATGTTITLPAGVPGGQLVMWARDTAGNENPATATTVQVPAYMPTITNLTTDTTQGALTASFTATAPLAGRASITHTTLTACPAGSTTGCLTGQGDRDTASIALPAPGTWQVSVSATDSAGRTTPTITTTATIASPPPPAQAPAPGPAPAPTPPPAPPRANPTPPAPTAPAPAPTTGAPAAPRTAPSAPAPTVGAPQASPVPAPWMWQRPVAPAPTGAPVNTATQVSQPIAGHPAERQIKVTVTQDGRTVLRGRVVTIPSRATVFTVRLPRALTRGHRYTVTWKRQSAIRTPARGASATAR